jgi:tetratricopeptide (TPR) repeat protein
MNRGRYVVPGSPDHRAMLLNNEASSLCKEGRFKEAEPLFLQALRLWESAFSPCSDPVAGCFQSLGVLRAALGDFDGAIFHLQRAIEIMTTLPVVDEGECAAYQGILDALKSGGRMELRAVQVTARKMWTG